MKSILLSIKPKYVADILNGRKTIEIRKTMPKCDLPIDVYIYCSKGSKKNWHLIEVVDTDTGWEGYEYDYYIASKEYLEDCLEGKVVAKFTLNKVEEINLVNIEDYSHDTYEYQTDAMIQDELCSKSGLSGVELGDYLSKKLKGYAWHISNLVIFDKPKELSEFYKYMDLAKRSEHMLCMFHRCNVCKNCQLTKAPQSWCYVEENN